MHRLDAIETRLNQVRPIVFVNGPDAVTPATEEREILPQFAKDERYLLNTVRAIEAIQEFVPRLEYAAHNAWVYCPYCRRAIRSADQRSDDFVAFPHLEGCAGLAFWRSVGALMEQDRL